ncbi:MAG: hypothetical protein ABIO05_02865 [Ferruginibacter sp.]
MIKYHNKTFRSTSTTGSGDVDAETIFIYRQDGNIVTASYAGGAIVSGHLIALMDEAGNLDMQYHHINDKNELRSGVCNSTLQLQDNGKMILHEKWKWTNGDLSSGESTLEEI